MSLKQGSSDVFLWKDKLSYRHTRGNAGVIVLLLVFLILTPVFSTVVKADNAPSLAIDQAHLDSISQTLRQKIQVTHHSPGQTTVRTKAKALSKRTVSATLPAYNNVGTSDDSTPGSVNFDGNNGGYSAQALSAAGLVPGQAFQIDGTVFTWPDAQAGVLNNYVVASQVIPVTPVANATTLAFLGASSGAPVSGTATITYTDNSTQNFTLGMSGWTLEGSKDQVTYGNLTAATMPYHNAPSGKQTMNTYLFYASVDMQAGKTIQSVKLPATGRQGQLHIFAVSTRASYNNVGSSDDAAPGAGNLDGGGVSYSNQALAKDGITPGASLTYNATNFTWPNVAGGTPNNYQARGQTIPVSPIANANTIAFLGAAANGPISGTATLNYTDGTTSAFALAMSDWTLNGGAAALAPGNSIAFTTSYRNTSAGTQLTNTYLFYAETSLKAGKTLQSITLPTISQGSLHIFSVATRSQQVPTFNNVGTSDDSSPGGANFDGAGASYSAQALQTAGLSAGKQISRDGIFFTWPNVPSGSPNNYQASGQVLPVTPVANAVEIGFLGASAYSNTSGAATITYADGSTQAITLAFTDWGAGAVASGNTTVASPAYFNTASGKATSHPANVYFSEFALQTGKVVQSVTLPTSLNQGQMHIFALGTRSYFNNIGITNGTDPSSASFDTSGNSYSAQEISDPNYVNWQPCDDLNYFGMHFTWPCVSANTPDNYLAQGQTIPVTSVANADTIGFVGSSTNGPSSGTAMINYTDGSTQSFTLGMSDWVLNGFTQAPSYRNRLFAGLTHYNSSSGQQTANVFIFYAEQKLQPDKTVQSVTLPSTVNQGQMHIFSIATGSTNNVPNDVGTSLDESTIFSSYDHESRSYSDEALKTAGIYPGQSFFFNGTQFNWTDSYSVIPDNYLAHGQTIPVTPVPNANTLAFVGGAAYGSAVGLATITYTDGTTHSFTLGLTDWYSSTSNYNNLLVTNMPYHNTVTGKENSATYLYYAETPLQPEKTIQSVTLPATTSPGEMHIFSIGTRASSQYNNTGITDDGDPMGGNYDGNSVPASWSAQALQSVGITAGANLTYNGIQFTWPNVQRGNFDNYQASGQVIPVTPVNNANTLAFLGSATNGSSTGTGTITYTNGNTQSFTLGLTDWTASVTASGNLVAATMPYRNIPTGRDTTRVSLFYSEMLLQPDKTVQSVTLPSSASPGQLHVFSIGTRGGVYYNNAGTSDDDSPGTASFDSNNNSYSAEALKSVGLVPGQPVAFDGIQFTWPNVPVGALNNYISGGQPFSVSPIAHATTLGFLGSATNGPAHGTLAITYTDGSTQNFNLGFSDWLLGAGNGGQPSAPSFGNIIVATTSHINGNTGSANDKAYVFGAEVALQPGKTVQSVRALDSIGSGVMHIFAIGTRADTPYNNAGISDDAHPQFADFDTAINGSYVPSNSYSDQALQAAGLSQGKNVTYNGVNFTWPNVGDSLYDNYQASGQTIPVTPVANATTLAFLGSATNGSSSGNGLITYTDGSTQSFTLNLTDWAVSPTAYGNLVVATMPYRNTPGGKQALNMYVFYTEVALQPNKVVQNVTLPSAASPGQLHVFSLGTRAGVYYNNAGTSDDSAPALAGFDNDHNSYSAQALQNVGVVPGQLVAFDGIPFTWPNAPTGALNNYIAQGQTLPVTPVDHAVKLGILGASTYADASGTLTITYTDGSTQTATLGLSDWLLQSNQKTQPSFGNTIVAATTYANSASGKANVKSYIFGVEIDLQPGKTVQSITLPSPNGSGIMHIFALGMRADTLYSNVGMSDDAHPQFADFDGASNGSYIPGSSYSDQALQAVGLSQGKSVTYNGVTFTWPNVSDSLYDNYQTNGQTVPVTPVSNATTLAFLGSATNGSSTGTGTITYTDGSTQNFTLGLTDWAVSPTAYGNGVVATMPYRNGQNGKDAITVYVYYTDVTLQAGKTVQSVTLPPYGSGGQLHVFAVGTK